MRRDRFRQIYVFRHSTITDACREALEREASNLVGKTVYRRCPSLEEAPGATDCLTSIHYLYKKALGIDLQLTWIGDMPRRLARQKEWKLLTLERKEAKLGDLLFTKNKKKPKLLSHATMIVDQGAIFHCAPDQKTARIVQDEAFFENYEQTLSLEKALCYIDPRNIALRKEQGGLFMQQINRERLKTLLKRYTPSELETGDCKRRFLDFVEKNERCFDREFEDGHVTASAWLLNHDKTRALLTHHRKFNQWMQLGGHFEKEDADLLSAAIREAREESGISTIEAIQTDLFDIDIHEIPKTALAPAHVHYDVRFLLYAPNPKEEIVLSDESNQLKWIGKDEIPESDPSVVRMFLKWKNR